MFGFRFRFCLFIICLHNSHAFDKSTLVNGAKIMKKGKGKGEKG
jgi:hypothetical protein